MQGTSITIIYIVVIVVWATMMGNECFMITIYIIYIYYILYIWEIKHANWHNSQHYSLLSFYFCRPMLQKMIKLNFKVYHVINWLKKNLFDIFVRKLGLIQELGQLIFYLVRNIFKENIYRKSALKSRAIPLFNFDK